MNRRAIIYTRVSTNEQTKGYSLPSQVKGCEEYARRHDLEVVAVFRDDISGATHLSEREGGQALLEMVDFKQISDVIVWRLDRLSRPPEGEYSRLLTTIEHLARHGVSVHDCESGEVRTDMMSIMIAFFKGLAASQEREAIRERTMRGIEEKAQAGKWIGQGDAPYGYQKVGLGRETRLEIHPERAEIVKRIFTLYIGIGTEPLSLKQIAALLTREGILSPGQAKSGGHKGRGGWYASTVSKRILGNTNYIGIFQVQGYVLHWPELALIDPDTWSMAQERREKNKVGSRRNQKRKYLLAGRITCICGATMQGESKVRRAGGWHIYYRCPNRRYDHLVEKCPVGYIRADLIEPHVLNGLYDMLSDPKVVESGLDKLTEINSAETRPLREELAVVEEMLEKEKRLIERLINRYSNEEDEVAAAALHRNYREKIELKQSLEKQRQGLLAKLSKVELTASLRDEIIHMSTEIAKTLPKGSYAKQRHLLDILNVTVQLLPGTSGQYSVEVVCYLWSSPLRIELSGRGFESRRPDRRVISQ